MSQPPCKTGECEALGAIHEIKERLARGDKELEDISAIKKGVFSILGVFIIQAGLLLYYAGGQVQKLSDLDLRMSRIEPQHNQLWYMHQGQK